MEQDHSQHETGRDDGAGTGPGGRNGAARDAQRRNRVAGAIFGSAVGDALGAPFEFGPPGEFSRRFPDDARGIGTEMCGGGSLGWQPGEFTDDTQQALLVAASLLDRDGLDEPDLFDRFRTWYAGRPPDVGAQTAQVLGSGLGWREAAADQFARTGHAATMDAARRISALTHGDPAAGESCAIFHELVRVALAGGDPLAAVDAALAAVPPEHRHRWATVLAPTWTPEQATESNGAVWPTLGSAVWALRRASSFTEAMRLVLDLGGDTDTVAAVAGGLAGTVYGVSGIPSRWSSAVHGTVPGHGDRIWRQPDLYALAARLDGRTAEPPDQPATDRIGPTELAPGIWAADLEGARYSDPEFAVISLCRTGTQFPHPLRRRVILMDDDSNVDLDAVLQDVLADIAALRADGEKVLVHCFGGASRTGLVVRSWLMRSEGLSAESATERVLAAWPYLGLWNDSFTEWLTGPRAAGPAG